MEVWPGKPFPLGPTWDGEGTNFAVFSAHASKVEVCLFSADGTRETARIALVLFDDVKAVRHAALGASAADVAG